MQSSEYIYMMIDQLRGCSTIHPLYHKCPIFSMTNDNDCHANGNSHGNDNSGNGDGNCGNCKNYGNGGNGGNSKLCIVMYL